MKNTSDKALKILHEYHKTFDDYPEIPNREIAEAHYFEPRGTFLAIHDA